DSVGGDVGDQGGFVAEADQDDRDVAGPGGAGQFADDVPQQVPPGARVAGDAQSADSVQVDKQVPSGAAANGDEQGQQRWLLVEVGGFEVGGQGPLRALVQPGCGRVVVGLGEQDVHVAVDEPLPDHVRARPAGQAGAEVAQGGVEAFDVGG